MWSSPKAADTGVSKEKEIRQGVKNVSQQGNGDASEKY